MELTEDELITGIRKVFSGAGPEVRVGPGDDAAVLTPGSGELVLSTDLLIEGVHFTRGTASARDVGAKAIAVNVSDIAAMGASPRSALLALGLSPEVDAAWAMELFGGVRTACDEYACWLVGGDLSRSDRVVLSVTLVGHVAAGRAVTRSGARVGDRILVTGSLGGSAGGLALSRVAPSSLGSALGTAWARALLDAHVRPVARVGEGQVLAASGASAMMDVSDGLALDLSRLCRESGVGARLRADSVPVSAELDALTGVIPDIDPLALALGGGEDYELLVTMASRDVPGAVRQLRDRFGVALTDIGEIVEEGLTILEHDGADRALAAEGWQHFGF